MNQDGERIEDKHINVLHVMENESFAEFADTLQKEIEDETGVKFGVLQLSLFSGMVYEERREVEKQVTPEQARAVVETLKNTGMIDVYGRISPTVQLRKVALPEALQPITAVVQAAVEQEKAVEVDTFTGIADTETVVEEKRFPIKKQTN